MYRSGHRGCRTKLDSVGHQEAIVNNLALKRQENSLDIDWDGGTNNLLNWADQPQYAIGMGGVLREKDGVFFETDLYLRITCSRNTVGW